MFAYQSETEQVEQQYVTTAYVHSYVKEFKGNTLLIIEK